MFNSIGELIVSLVYIAIFLFIIKRAVFFSDKEVNKSWFYITFAIKLLAGFALTWIYTYYYTDRLAADIYKYFDDSKILFESLSHHPEHFFAMITGINDQTPVIQAYYDKMLNWHKMDLIYNDNAILIRFNALLRFFSLGYFSVHTIVMVFISYSGLAALFHVFKNSLNCKPVVTLLFLMLFPSILFWTSGVLKDALLLGLFGLLLYQLYSIKQNGFTITSIVILITLVFLLVQIKLYVLLIAAPGITLWLLYYNSSTKFLRQFLVWVCTYAIIAVVALNIQHISPKYNVPQMLSAKQFHFNRLAQNVESGSFIELNKLEPNIFSVVLNSPKAFVNVLLRPHVFESKNALTILAALENLFIFLIILVAIRYINIKKLRYANAMFFYSIFFFVFIFILIGLVTPVLGAIVRYKVIALPFLLFTILYMIDFSKSQFLKIFEKNGL